MMSREINGYSGADLSEDERKALRQIIEDRKRTRWLWGWLNRIVIAIGAVGVALTTVKGFLGSYLK